VSVGVSRSHSVWSAYARVARAQTGPDRLQRQPRTSPVRTVKRRREMGRWGRSGLLGTTARLASIHDAAAADPIPIHLNGYLPAANRYCISARSVQGDPQTGFLWRFSVGGGPSAPIAPTNFVDLTNTTSTNMFPTSLADHEKFRVYQNLFGPILGGPSISNELNAFRDQICLDGGGGGGGRGGG